MVLNSLYWMDETISGLLSQSTQLPLPKFHHNEQTQQILSSQLSSLFKPSQQIPKETSTADNNRVCSGSSTPKKSSNPLNEFLKPHSILSQNNSSESDDDEEHSKKEEINLYPLSNQVGGHTRLLLLNDKTVIKPLNIRELEFYQNIPENDILHFVPSYKGENFITRALHAHVMRV